MNWLTSKYFPPTNLYNPINKISLCSRSGRESGKKRNYINLSKIILVRELTRNVVTMIMTLVANSSYISLFLPFPHPSLCSLSTSFVFLLWFYKGIYKLPALITSFAQFILCKCVLQSVEMNTITLKRAAQRLIQYAR